MESRLLQAAATGDLNSLRSLMREDMFLLETVALVGPETPLHIASMCGHLPFVQEMLKVKKQFAYELNQDEFSPLHLASAIGHVQIVHELLNFDPKLCAIRGREGRLPVHCAVVKGRIDVVEKLLSAFPVSVESTTAGGETLFHLAVKNNQIHALKSLVEHVKLFKKEHVLNHKDHQGNTILHLATSRKQYEVVHFLLHGDNVTKEVMEVNRLNKAGMSALDVLMLFQSEAGDLEIHTTLVKAGAKSGKATTSTDAESSETHKSNMQPLEIINDVPPTNTSPTQQSQPVKPRRTTRYWPRLSEVIELYGYNDMEDSRSDVREALLTVAALMVTATYQAVLSPPGGVWQDDKDGHSAGKSIMGTKSEATFWLFIFGNSVGFYTSLHMIAWLTAGFPLRYPLLLLMGSISMNYSGSIVSLIPEKARLITAVVVAIAFGYLSPLIPSLLRRLRCCPRRA